MKDKIAWIVEQHNAVNHYYGPFPYSYHLRQVADLVEEFYDSVTDPTLPSKEVCVLAAWGHDLLEDCHVNYSDVKKHLGEEIADIIYALTEEKGKTRRQRQGKSYYTAMKEVPGALFIKLCDRLANLRSSKKNAPKKYARYKAEMGVILSWRGYINPTVYKDLLLDYVKVLGDPLLKRFYNL